MTIKSKRSVLPSHRFGVVAIVIIFAVSLVAATAEQARADRRACGTGGGSSQHAREDGDVRVVSGSNVPMSSDSIGTLPWMSFVPDTIESSKALIPYLAAPC